MKASHAPALTGEAFLSLGQRVGEECNDCAAREVPEDEHQPYPRMPGRQDPVIRATLSYYKREGRHANNRAADKADDGENEPRRAGSLP